MKFKFLTLFPEVFAPFLDASLMGKAKSNGLVDFELIQIRDFATDKHRTVDDTPYGGGEGMVLRADVLHAAWLHAMGGVPTGTKNPKTLTLLTSPQGKLLDQPQAQSLAQGYETLIIVCGHYEGIDERFIELCVDQEVSIGNYVLTGGELPALVIADGVTRLLPGVVGNSESIKNDSLEGGLLKYPQYTKPREFEGLPVPPVLLGGNHAEIGKWRDLQRISRTQKKRPDLKR